MTANSTPFHDVKATSDGVFNTTSARLIDIRNPCETSFEIWDIATALSHICRFGGHVSRFYSVAQHSILVSHLVPEDLKKEALMHDATEAYLGDVIKPLKILLGASYASIETNFETVICQKYGLNRRLMNAVKEADLLALELEHEALQMGNATRLIATMQRNDMVLPGSRVFYTPTEARAEFLRAFGILFPNQVTDHLNGSCVN